METTVINLASAENWQYREHCNLELAKLPIQLPSNMWIAIDFSGVTNLSHKEMLEITLICATDPRKARISFIMPEASRIQNKYQQLLDGGIGNKVPRWFGTIKEARAWIEEQQ